MDLRHYLKVRFAFPISLICLAAATMIVSGQFVIPISETISHKEFPCLPKTISLEDVVEFGHDDKPHVTVKDKLIKLKARCRKGKLVGATRREIRFFKPQCWGNPPPDHLEIEKRQREELTELKKKYTVVEIACNRLEAH